MASLAPELSSPAERLFVGRETGFEPATSTLASRSSTGQPEVGHPELDSSGLLRTAVLISAT